MLLSTFEERTAKLNRKDGTVGLSLKPTVPPFLSISFSGILGVTNILLNRDRRKQTKDK